MIKFFTVTALALVATPAFSQEYPPAPPAPNSAPQGLRIEARAGADIVRVEADGDSGSRTGFDYSLEAGYDIGLAGAVVGAYAGIGDSTTKACDEVFGDDRACLTTGRNITVGLRAGAALNPTTLVYVKGGYSNGRASVRYRDFIDPDFDFKVSDERDGFHLGAGVEYGFGTNTYLKGEYVYTNYSSDDYEGFGLDIDRHQLLAGVGVRF